MMCAVSAGFGFLIFRAYRQAHSRAESGEPFAPAGKMRWSSGSKTED